MANATTELPLLAARLKAAGAVGIRREMVAGLRAAAAPVIPLIQEEARTSLPKKGGLAESMAAKKPKTSVRTTGRRAGVSVTYKGIGVTTDLAGGWRHPVFARGSRDQWRWAKAKQEYAPAVDWFKRGADRGKPAAMAAAQGVLASVAAEVQGLGIR